MVCAMPVEFMRVIRGREGRMERDSPGNVVPMAIHV